MPSGDGNAAISDQSGVLFPGPAPAAPVVHLLILTTTAPLIADVTLGLGLGFRRPVRYRMAFALPRGQPRRAEVRGTVETFDRARRPAVHPGHPDIRGETVQHGFVRGPPVRRHPTLSACVDPFLERVERFQRVRHPRPRPPGDPVRIGRARCGAGVGGAGQPGAFGGWCGRSWSGMCRFPGLATCGRACRSGGVDHVTVPVGRGGRIVTLAPDLNATAVASLTAWIIEHTRCHPVGQCTPPDKGGEERARRFSRRRASGSSSATYASLVPAVS